MSAEHHLAELQKIATATLKAAKLAARNQGLVLVDAARLAQLEALHEAASVAFCGALMTRDYKDVLDDNETYNGKRYLISRDDGDNVFRALSALGCKTLPAGCLAGRAP